MTVLMLTPYIVVVRFNPKTIGFWYLLVEKSSKILSLTNENHNFFFHQKVSITLSILLLLIRKTHSILTFSMKSESCDRVLIPSISPMF